MLIKKVFWIMYAQWFVFKSNTLLITITFKNKTLIVTRWCQRSSCMSISTTGTLRENSTSLWWITQYSTSSCASILDQDLAWMYVEVCFKNYVSIEVPFTNCITWTYIATFTIPIQFDIELEVERDHTHSPAESINENFLLLEDGIFSHKKC